MKEEEEAGEEEEGEDGVEEEGRGGAGAGGAEWSVASKSLLCLALPADDTHSVT